jgi:hypothetical protein
MQGKAIPTQGDGFFHLEMAHLFTFRHHSARAGVPALATLDHAKA